MRILVYILVFLLAKTNLIAAEAGMPQLDKTYWLSQAFWLVLVFSLLYFCINNIFLPKIKNNLSNREKKIKDNLEEAKLLKDNASQKKQEYINALEDGKKSVQKIISEAKKKLNQDIESKKEDIEKKIQDEIYNANNEIKILKTNSILTINKIAEDLSSKIIEDISGDKLNESSIKATVSEISKNKLKEHLS